MHNAIRVRERIARLVLYAAEDNKDAKARGEKQPRPLSSTEGIAWLSDAQSVAKRP